MMARTAWSYWVAYGHSAGFGGAGVTLDAPIASADEVVDLGEWVSAEIGTRDVVVLSWQLLSAPAAEPVQEPVDTSVSAPADAASEPAGPVERRVALIGGLRELAEALEAHPGMPAPDYVSVNWYALNEVPDMTEAEAVAAVDRAAEALGMQVWDSLSTGHYTVGPKTFGPPSISAHGGGLPAVLYSAGYISARAKAEHEARQAAERAGTGGGER